jgi:hypothetical protein
MAGRWFSSTNKTDIHEIPEILLKVEIKTTLNPMDAYL